MELIETRRISGRGVLKLPDANKNYRRFCLIGTVLRLPISQFINRDYNPEKSLFATLTFFRSGNVVYAYEMNWENQSWDFYPPYDGQVQLALKCAYQGTLESIRNLGIALGLTEISFENGIKEYTELVDIWDEVRIVCYSSAAIQLDLYALNYAVCDQEFKKPSPPPPPPDEPPPPPDPPTVPPPEGSPPNVPYPPPIPDLSPPYDSNTNDGGNTVPFPGDANPPPEPPTQGEQCQLYVMNWEFDVTFGGSPAGTVSRTTVLFGKIGAFRVDYTSGTSRVFIQCQGVNSGGVGNYTSVCLAFNEFLISDNGQSYPQIAIVATRIVSLTVA